MSNVVPLRAGKIEPSADADFDEFWAAYPRHEAMKEARAAYKRARKLVSHETLLAGAKQHASQYDPEYATLAHKWLNGERWNDEPVKRNGRSEAPRIDLSNDVVVWRNRLMGYAKSRFWPPMWGDPPDHPKCDAPVSLLREFGFLKSESA